MRATRGPQKLWCGPRVARRESPAGHAWPAAKVLWATLGPQRKPCGPRVKTLRATRGPQDVPCGRRTRAAWLRGSLPRLKPRTFGVSFSGFDVLLGAGRQSEVVSVLGVSGLGLALGALQQWRRECLAAQSSETTVFLEFCFEGFHGRQSEVPSVLEVSKLVAALTERPKGVQADRPPCSPRPAPRQSGTWGVPRNGSGRPGTAVSSPLSITKGSWKRCSPQRDAAAQAL